MGIFYETTEVINRTSKTLNVRFDGQDMTLEPNYDENGKRLSDVRNLIPSVAVPYARNQNVLMGSEHPLDPSDFETLVGAVAKKGQKQKDKIDYCEQSDEPTQVKLDEYLDDESLKIKPGGRRKVRRGDATEGHRDIAPVTELRER